MDAHIGISVLATRRDDDDDDDDEGPLHMYESFLAD